MDYLALKVFPLALLIVSAAALALTPRQYPAFAALMVFNVIRSWEYLAACCTNNPKASMISAFLMLLAAEESLRRAGMRPWASVFCLSTGAWVASIAVTIGDAANPLKSGLHVAGCAALAIGIVVCWLRGCRSVARSALLLAYVAGAAVASKQPIVNEWWSILSVQVIHCAVLTAYLWLAVSERFATSFRPGRK